MFGVGGVFLLLWLMFFMHLGVVLRGAGCMKVATAQAVSVILL